MEPSQVIEKMERETGIEPATSSLGTGPIIQSKKTCAFLTRFCDSTKPRQISNFPNKPY